MSMDLTDNQVNGKIPAELGRLTKLRWLLLSGNDLSGTLSRELTNLTDLESFCIHKQPGLCAPVDDEFPRLAPQRGRRRQQLCH